MADGGKVLWALRRAQQTADAVLVCVSEVGLDPRLMGKRELAHGQVDSDVEEECRIP